MKLVNVGTEKYCLAIETGYLYLNPGEETEVKDELAKIIIGKKGLGYEIKSTDGTPINQAEIQAEPRRPGRPRKI
jgi:hypothetical protein